MESSIAEFLSRKLACELLPTNSLLQHASSSASCARTGPATHQGTQFQQGHLPILAEFTITAFTS